MSKITPSIVFDNICNVIIYVASVHRSVLRWKIVEVPHVASPHAAT